MDYFISFWFHGNTFGVIGGPSHFLQAIGKIRIRAPGAEVKGELKAHIHNSLYESNTLQE